MVRKLVRSSATVFLLATLVIAFLKWLPWSAPLALIEIPLQYLPQWLPLLLLLPLILFWRQALRLPKLLHLMLGLGICYIVVLHMDYVLPFKSIGRDAAMANVRVLSANLAQVDAMKFGALLRFTRPDVIVTQEIKQPELAALLADASSQLLASAIDASGLPNAIDNTGSKDSYWRLHCKQALCVASRYPFAFVDAQSRRFRGAWGLMGAAYDVDVNGEPLRIYNVHLETVRKGFEDVFSSRFDLQPVLENAKNRRIEADLLSSWVGQQDSSVIVGDFNMTTGESLYREYFSQFRNAFTEVGFGFGHTKVTRLLGVRIDHLLSTENVLPVTARVTMDVGSDHRPLLVDLALGL